MVGAAPEEVGIDILGVEADGLVVVLDGTLEFAQVVVGAAPEEVGIDILGVEADGLVIVLDGPLEFAQVVVGATPSTWNVLKE